MFANFFITMSIRFASDEFFLFDVRSFSDGVSVFTRPCILIDTWFGDAKNGFFPIALWFTVCFQKISRDSLGTKDECIIFWKPEI